MNKEIVVIGGMNMDIQGQANCQFITNDSNPGHITYSAGGVGRNIAENLTYLFCESNLKSETTTKVHLISVIGDDILAHELIKDCQSKKIDLSGCLKLENTNSPQYLCLLNNDGKLIGAVSAMACLDNLSSQYIATQTTLLDAAQLIIMDTNIAERTINWVTTRYNKTGPIKNQPKLPIIGLDCVSTSKAQKAINSLAGLDFIKANLDEALVLSGDNDITNQLLENKINHTYLTVDQNHSDNAIRLINLAEKIHQKGVLNCFISLGKQGIFYSNHKIQGRVFANTELLANYQVINVSGAGDSACATIAWGLNNNYSINECAALGVLAATYTCNSIQTVNPLIKNIANNLLLPNILAQLNYESY